MAEISNLFPPDEPTEEEPSTSAPVARKRAVVPAPVDLPFEAGGESYDQLENDLALGSLPDGIRSILVTSPDAAAGVSTVAARFAEAVAADPSVRVLLVDAQLRSPAQHRLFELPGGYGLADVLRGDTQAVTLATTKVGNLHVLPAGRLVNNPHRLFRRSLVTSLLRDLTQAYDFVIIDAPPINSCIETRTLASAVDGVTLIIRAGLTRPRSARLARHRIEKTGTRLIGVVLNGARQYIPRWLYDRL